MTSSTPAPAEGQAAAEPARSRLTEHPVVAGVLVAVLGAALLGLVRLVWTTISADATGTVAVVRAGGSSLGEFRAEGGLTGSDEEGVRAELTLETSHAEDCSLRFTFVNLEAQRPVAPAQDVQELMPTPLPCGGRVTAWVPLPAAELPQRVAVEFELFSGRDSLGVAPTADLGVGGGAPD